MSNSAPTHTELSMSLLWNLLNVQGTTEGIIYHDIRVLLRPTPFRQPGPFRGMGLQTSVSRYILGVAASAVVKSWPLAKRV